VADGGPVIEARGLRKIYRGGSIVVEALRGVDLAVERGEMVAIMGPSGCGKTTLLHCLSGLDDFEGGDVLLEGVSLRAMSDDQRTDFRARKTGFVFQAYNLLPVLTALENVELPLQLVGVNGRDSRSRAQAALEAVGLADRADHRPNQLSGGQQQRVAIARALVNEPAVIWADEPTGNLDSEAAAEILELFERLHRRRGQTFVIVTHAAAVAEIVDRVLWMSDGSIVGERRPPAGEQQPPIPLRAVG
jgi:putative ABC transport system ATP-binding protein